MLVCIAVVFPFHSCIGVIISLSSLLLMKISGLFPVFGDTNNASSTDWSTSPRAHVRDILQGVYGRVELLGHKAHIDIKTHVSASQRIWATYTLNLSVRELPLHSCKVFLFFNVYFWPLIVKEQFHLLSALQFPAYVLDLWVDNVIHICPYFPFFSFWGAKFKDIPVPGHEFFATILKEGFGLCHSGYHLPLGKEHLKVVLRSVLHLLSHISCIYIRSLLLILWVCICFWFTLLLSMEKRNRNAKFMPTISS